MPNADMTAMKAILRKVEEDLGWIAEQLLELKRDCEREAEANREDFQQLNPNRKNKTHECNEIRR